MQKVIGQSFANHRAILQACFNNAQYGLEKNV